ncbi:MAG: hypothetical protein Phog2KO_36440 [Phototrophicaceae bacterium]
MSPILEVVIGLIFIFSLLSVLVTQINTIIAQSLRLRSNYLFETVKDIIHDPELIARFVTHPLIRMIDLKNVKGMEKWDAILPQQELTKEQAQHILTSTLNGIEWIKPETFSNVLLSMIRVDQDQLLFGVLDDIAEQMDDREARLELRRVIKDVTDTGTGVNELVNTINGLPASAHKNALIERMRDISIEVGSKGLKTDINVSLMAGVQTIKDRYLKNAIHTILTTSKTVAEAEAKIEDWFNRANERATETFSRDMKRYSYLIGLLVAILINVDTMYIATKLWEDPLLRSAVAETASAVDIDELQRQLDEANNNINSTDSTELADVTDSVAVAGRTLSQIQDARVPIGWSFESLSDITDDSLDVYKLSDSRYITNLMPWNNPNWLWLLGMKIVGIVATMLAIGQGAPFWFNLLRQIR